jgi:hypothetical protein
VKLSADQRVRGKDDLARVIRRLLLSLIGESAILKRAADLGSKCPDISNIAAGELKQIETTVQPDTSNVPMSGAIHLGGALKEHATIELYPHLIVRRNPKEVIPRRVDAQAM